MKMCLKNPIMPILLIISGALMALPFIFPVLGFLQWVSLVPAALVFILSAENKEIKPRRLYFRGLLYFWSFYAVSFHWFFYMYPLDFAGLSNAASIAVVLVACFGLSFFQAVWSAFAVMLFAKISRSEIMENMTFAKPFLAAALFVIAELWQTVGWWGVPWGRLPIGQMNAVLLVRSASVFGSYFISFVIVAVNFCLAYLILKKDMRKIFTAIAATVFAFNLVLGTLVTVFYKESYSTVKVAAAQGNISSSEKWSGSSYDKLLETYRELTEQAADSGADVVVWPETALPYELFSDDELCEYVSNLAKDNQVTLIISAFTEVEDSDMLANSMIEVKSDGSFGKKIYIKQRLVPFGEFVPMREIVSFVFPPLADVGMLADDLYEGEESVVIETGKGKIGCGLCFDSIYESYMLDSVKNGAQYIAIATNDSWFSDSAALDMHNSQSRLRAIETGRYVVRSANTGISSVIDPLGNVKTSLGANETGYVISEIELRDSRTVYSYIGNFFVYLCVGFVGAIVIFGSWKKDEKQGDF